MTKKTPPSDPSENPNRSEMDKVGPGNPPSEYQWKKGDPSPNPRGRPKKKHLKGLFASLNPSAAAVLANARRVIGEVNGEEITNYDGIMHSLAKRAHKETAASRLYTQLTGKAQAEEQEVKNGMLLAAVQHKEKYGPQFAFCERMGKELPNIFPHPDDLIIGPDGSVRIVGPGTEEDQINLKAILKLRDALIEAGTMVARAEGRKTDKHDAQKFWSQLRSKFYRFNAVIPPRLKKPFPRFET